MAEATSGDYAPWSGATFRGAHAVLGYALSMGRVVDRVEPMFRASHDRVLAPGSADDGDTLLTPGIAL